MLADEALLPCASAAAGEHTHEAPEPSFHPAQPPPPLSRSGPTDSVRSSPPPGWNAWNQSGAAGCQPQVNVYMFAAKLLVSLPHACMQMTTTVWLQTYKPGPGMLQCNHL